MVKGDVNMNPFEKINSDVIVLHDEVGKPVPIVKDILGQRKRRQTENIKGVYKGLTKGELATDKGDVIMNFIDTLGKLMTKTWRKIQPWYEGGRKNECEKIQRQAIECITEKSCLKSDHIRLNTQTYKLTKKTRPLNDKDGFDWTEDFDGEQHISSKRLLYNFKMVCDNGGAQTRSLREVYHFITTQLEYIKKNSIWAIGHASTKWRHSV